MSDEVTAQILAGLNRIEEKVDRHHRDATKRLDDHMSEEAAKLKAVRAQHVAILEKITAHMNETAAMRSAFLHTHDNQPDYQGHYSDHDTRKKLGDWLADARNKTLIKLIEYCTLGFVAWVVVHLWKGLLEGPK